MTWWFLPGEFSTRVLSWGRKNRWWRHFWRRMPWTTPTTRIISCSSLARMDASSISHFHFVISSPRKTTFGEFPLKKIQRRLGSSICGCKINLVLLFTWEMRRCPESLVRVSGGGVELIIRVVWMKSWDYFRQWFSCFPPTEVELEKDTNSRSIRYGSSVSLSDSKSIMVFLITGNFGNILFKFIFN